MWHCDDDNITEISDLPKQVYYRETHKPTKKKKKLIKGSTDVLFVVYIRTSHLAKHSCNCFQEFKIMSKSTLVEKLFEEQNLLRSEVMVKNKLMTKYKNHYYIKDELQNSIENNLLEGRKKGK